MNKISVFLLILSIAIDSILSFMFPFDFTYIQISFVPCFSLVCLVLMTFYVKKRQVFISALIYGIVFDLFYADFILIYVVLYFLTLKFCYLLKKSINDTFLELTFLVVSTFLFKELLLYLFLKIVAYTSLGFGVFFYKRIMLSLVVAILALICLRLLYEEYFYYHTINKELQKSKERVWLIK